MGYLGGKNVFRRWARRLVLVILISHSVLTAFALRFEFAISEDRIPILVEGILVALVTKSLVFGIRGLDRGGWRYADTSDLRWLFLSNVAASTVFALANYWIVGPRFPRSVYIIDFLLCFLTTSAIRLCVHMYYEPGGLRNLASWRSTKNTGVLVYGAGVAGRYVLREILANPGVGYRVLGFLDDDLDKQGMTIRGVKVLGGGRQAATVVDSFRRHGRKVEEIIVALPSATPRELRDVLANCRAAGISCKTVPSLSDMLSGKVKSPEFRDVSYTDLLGREPVYLDTDRVQASVRGCNVLVTGGAGSIGSELCRQLTALGPDRLVIFEQAESDLFRIENELREGQKGARIVSEIGNIREYDRVREVLRHHSIDLVFHAAAYKHVPMMEHHPIEAVATNVIGTYNLARAAREQGTSTFLMISSDKAVNPTSIMGLTKRVSELIVSSMPPGRTKFVSVRFGNVLGSNGSVVPVFKKQIAAGGPVTVTHPEMRRYFMTIPEAVQLVLEASPTGKGGEIFVLDMGEPVLITDLARSLISMAERDDIEIRFTGVRPGEKLFEELNGTAEHLIPTHHPKIKIFAGPKPSSRQVSQFLDVLGTLLAQRDEAAIIAAMSELVPEYEPSERWQDACFVKRAAAVAVG